MKPSQLAQTLQSVLTPYQNRKRWVVALSGGLDSTVLLHAVAAMEKRPELCALHIHHGLQSQADQWQRQCESLCRDLGVAFSALNVTVVAGSGPEAAARDARYQAFSEFLQCGDVLLQAHHQDDQVETLFLRLLRGTGVDGMQGIPESRALADAELVRPLLLLPREELERYAELSQLSWVEDPSNSDERFDRNFLRQRILPLLEERWPAYRETVTRFARHASEAGGNTSTDISGLLQSSGSAYAALDVELLRAMAETGRKTAIRQWLSQRDLRPTEAQLKAIQRDMVFASRDAEPLIELGSVQLRRFEQRLYLTELADFDAAYQQHWDFSQPLLIPGAGWLSAEACEQGGLQADSVLVRLRRGGERCTPLGRRHSRSLKKLLQEHHIAPWRRDRLPLLFVGEELAAVADLWVCEGHAGLNNADLPTATGWRLRWSPME